MKNSFVFLLLSLLTNFLHAQFEGNQTPTYEKLVHFYDSLALKNNSIELYKMGESDAKYPIYLCVLNGEGDSLKTMQNKSQKLTLFINNGIHPGEPDGINACGKITMAFLENKSNFPKNVRFAFILCYNVGGMLNRSAHSRANQNGPVEYGFRGNAQNLDLNRDFIKMDSPNAQTFATVFHALNPEVFVDTHVSNGADYQYTLSLIHSLKERLSPQMRMLTYDKILPDLTKKLAGEGIELIPYVELIGETPENGIIAFNDLPRYAMGYASLFSCVAITTETHMLKPFENRVEATRIYLVELWKWMSENKSLIQTKKKESEAWLQAQKNVSIRYISSDKADSLLFLGYEASHLKSGLSEEDRLFYDRLKPYQKNIPYFNKYAATDTIQVPLYYVVEAQCKEVIEKLKLNQVQFYELKNDSLVQFNRLVMTDFQTVQSPYEGHYLHYKTNSKEVKTEVVLRPGSILIPTKQKNFMYILQVLEPKNEDSFFAWNYFDSYLQQKEYFSGYVFEDIAVELLKKDQELAKEFQSKLDSDPAFAKNHDAQLNFIYERSDYFEGEKGRLPIGKIY